MNNLDLLAPTNGPETDTWTWATVTQASPLRVRLDGDSAPLAVTPECLYPDPSVGQRVWVQLTGRRVVIHAPSNGITSPTKTIAALRAAQTVSGGGMLSVSLSWEVKWGARFIVMGNGQGSHFSTSGYFDINYPPVGTVIQGVGGATSQSAGAAGIPLPVWTALYYVLPIGSGSPTVNSNFRLVSYGSDFVVPENWLLLANRNPDVGTVRWCNDVTIGAGRSWFSDDTQGWGARRYYAGNYIAAGTMQALTWQTDYDQGPFVSPDYPASDFKIPVGMAGKYLVIASAGFETSAWDQYIQIYLSSTSATAPNRFRNNNDYNSVLRAVTVVNLPEGCTVSAGVYTGNAGYLNPNVSEFTITKIG